MVAGEGTRARRFGTTVAVAACLGGLIAAPAPAAAADETFTIVVLPDTQGYTATTTFEATMGAQTQWIVDSADDLNTKFVVQVGDLVESWPNVNHWQRASRYMATLDNAGVPNSVLPGNHDLNITTGESNTYDTYFPPSRYASASWNSPEVSYGGYLGQNLFGPDEIDRKNKDNFALLSVAGIDLLILNLEFESPAYTLRWAQKVIDAHPDRRVILATHGFINTAGVRASHVIRTDTIPISAVTLWNDFVSRNCSIFMVVNGHWHDGDIGEARRTDPNACGEPVHQILSNYQSRVNGGNGWLRYYTFNPSAGTVDAFTYSPTLGQYETDTGSRFTLPIDLGPGRNEVLVAGGGDWRWRNSTATWPTGWAGAAYDDTAWPTGRAPLGWGSSVATNIDLAPPTTARARAMIFRSSFDLANVQELEGVTVSTRADDGVAVWVNGTLVGTAHLQGATPTSSTYASAVRTTSVATATPTTFAVPATLLKEGRNVIAASAHVNYRGTPDSSFDLVMTARRTPDAPAPPGPPAVTATALGPTSVRIAWTPGPGPAPMSVEITRTGGSPVAVPGASGVWDDTTAAAGVENEYRVVALGTDGSRSSPTVVRVTTPAETPAPGAPVVTATVNSPTSVTLAWSPGGGGPTAGVEITRTGGSMIPASGESGSYTDQSAPSGSTVEYSVVAVGPQGARSAPTVVTAQTPPASQPVPVTLVTANATWRYRYAAGAWPTSWTTPEFADSSWAQGAAPLGFGSSQIATVVDVPPPTSNRPISMTFRNTFSVDTPAALSGLKLNVRADDGVVVWVNGVEVGRSRMPSGAVVATTYANAAPRAATAASSPLVIPIASSLLRSGSNTIAASTHLNYRGTPDVTFLATLEGSRAP